MRVKKVNIYKAAILKRGAFALVIVVLIICANFISIPPKIADYIDIIKGNMAYENNAFDDAEVLYKTVLKNEPHLTNVLYNLGNAYYKQERYQEAVQTYKSALYNDGSKPSSKTWNNLGNAYYMQGELELGANAYKNALLLNDTDTEIRRNLLLVLSMVDAKNNRINSNKKDGQNFGKKADENGQNKNKTPEKSNHQQGKPSGNKMSADEIATLFNIIKQNERAVGKKISSSRSKNNISTSDDSEY